MNYSNQTESSHEGSKSYFPRYRQAPVNLPDYHCAPHVLWEIGSHRFYVVFVFFVFIPFYSASHSISFSEALPTTAIDTVSEFTRRSVNIKTDFACCERMF